MAGWSDIHGTVPVAVPPDEGEVEGKVILLRNGISGYVKAKFEVWLLTNAEVCKQQLRKSLQPMEYKEVCQNHDASKASGTYQWMGDAKVQRGIDLFAKCQTTNEWAGYPDRICYPTLPKWAEEEEVRRQLEGAQ